MKKRFLSILLVLVMVIGMIPFSALSASALGLADYYTTVTIGDDVYDIATMPGNHSGEGYYVTSTSPQELVIELKDYNGGPIKVESDNLFSTKYIVEPIIKVYGDCVITVPDNYDGYGIEFLSEYVIYHLDFEFVEDASLTIQGGGGGICVTGIGYFDDFSYAWKSPRIVFVSNPFAKLNIDVDGGYGIYMPSFEQEYALGIEKPLINIKTSAGYTAAYFCQDDGYTDALEKTTSWSNAEYHKLTAIGGTIYAGSSLSLSMGSENSFESGTTVKLVAPEIAGKYFTGWEFSREDAPFTDEEKKQSELVFEMPNCDLTATATYINLDTRFAFLYPNATSTEEKNGYTPLSEVDLGSNESNIDFAGYPAGLSNELIADGWSVERGIKVIRDGIEILDKTYESNDTSKWNLKNNIDDGGNYRIIVYANYYLNSQMVNQSSHEYSIKVNGDTIKNISVVGIGTPVIGSAPSHAEFAFSNTDGVIIKKVQWEYYSSEMGGGFVNMPDGSKFEEGKRYAVLLELETADGYSFAANKEDMTVYINGQKAKLTYNYTNNEFGVELEMTPITDPAFIVTPVGGNVAEGEKFTITWETNFKPAWIQILTFNSANGAPNDAIDVPADATSFELDANEFGYVLTVYYNGNQCVSNGEKFYVKAIKGISEVDVTVTEPTVGGTASKNITVNTEGAVATFMWVEVNGDGTYKAVADNAIFESGKQYAAMITIRSANLNEYMLKEDVVVKVNGKEATNLAGLYVLEYEPLLLINSIELEVAKPVIGEAPTKPTIKSVNMDENLKDLVSFFSDTKVYWVEADSAEDIANGNKNPTVFADGKIYALHVAIQSTKEFAEDCVLNVYGTDGELLWSGNISFSDPSDKTLVYTDAYLGNFKLEIGNVNGDDLIDFTDLQRLYQHITGDNPLSGDALGAADVNADTVIDFSDLQALFALLSQNA